MNSFNKKNTNLYNQKKLFVLRSGIIRIKEMHQKFEQITDYIN